MSWESILKRFVTQRELDVLINEFKMMVEDEAKYTAMDKSNLPDMITRLRLLARDELDVKQLLNEDSSFSSKYVSEYGYDIDNFYAYELDKLEHEFVFVLEGMLDETQEQFEEIKEAILWRVRNS